MSFTQPGAWGKTKYCSPHLINPKALFEEDRRMDTLQKGKKDLRLQRLDHSIRRSSPCTGIADFNMTQRAHRGGGVSAARWPLMECAETSLSSGTHWDSGRVTKPCRASASATASGSTMYFTKRLLFSIRARPGAWLYRLLTIGCSPQPG